jgi:hypothetical protein
LKLGGQAPAGTAVTTGATAKAMAQPEATNNLAIGFRIAISRFRPASSSS